MPEGPVRDSSNNELRMPVRNLSFNGTPKGPVRDFSNAIINYTVEGLMRDFSGNPTTVYQLHLDSPNRWKYTELKYQYLLTVARLASELPRHQRQVNPPARRRIRTLWGPG